MQETYVMKNDDVRKWSMVYNLCPRDCKYGGKIIESTRINCCDYLLITGEPRGCEVEGCDKYEPRRKKRMSGWKKSQEKKKEAQRKK